MSASRLVNQIRRSQSTGERSACAGDVKSPRRGSIIIAGGAMQSDGNHHRSELGG